MYAQIQLFVQKLSMLTFIFDIVSSQIWHLVTFMAILKYKIISVFMSLRYCSTSLNMVEKEMQYIDNNFGT